MKNPRNLLTLSRFFMHVYAAAAVTIASGETSINVKIQRNSIRCNSTLSGSYPTTEYLDSYVSSGGRVHSEVVCAMKALRRRALAYAYRNGSCLLIGEGESLDCRFDSYVPIDQGLLNMSALERDFESFLPSEEPPLVYESNNVIATTLEYPTSNATVTETAANISSAAVTESTSTTSATVTVSSTTATAAVTESVTATQNILDVTVRDYIEVAATGKIFATDHKQTLSTSYPKELAIDRDTMTKYISSSLSLSKPWWMVDLKGVRSIKMIYVLPYVECGIFCVDAMHIMFYAGNTLVKDGNFDSFNNVANYWGVYNSNLGYLIASVYTNAQYVAIVLNGEIGLDVLALTEVLVFVEP